MARAGKRSQTSPSVALHKSPTGIKGLDEITGGGLPQGRPTLICGSAGCGKTVFGMEFLVRGALEYGEPGVFMSFEETEEDLMKNFESLGFNLSKLLQQKKLSIDHVFIERSEIEETGEYDLEGLFIRLGLAIDEVGAKRVVLDTIESLFGGFPNEGVLRAELRRLFRWLKDRKVTAIITGERGSDTLTRHGLEEYVADCVIVLDHRVTEQVSTRRLRVVKYRGSGHAPDEYPFLIHSSGISLLPISALGLNHSAPKERISTGIERLDTMLAGKGYFRNSTVLVSGSAGTGKTSVAAHFINAACSGGERGMYLAFEESPDQIARNMNSIGMDLEKWVKKGLLQFRAVRPTQYGLESHLTAIHKSIEEFKPSALVIDPISNFLAMGENSAIKTMFVRLFDFLKMQGITTVCTDLTSGGVSLEQTDVGISSLADTWILLRSLESNGERNRTLYIVKSRGMAHSDQIREFQLTNNGVKLVDVYVGPSGVLTGAARASREALETAEALVREQEIELKKRELERKRILFEARMAELNAEFESEQEEIQKAIRQNVAREELLKEGRRDMSKIRKGDPGLGRKS